MKLIHFSLLEFFLVSVVVVDGRTTLVPINHLGTECWASVEINSRDVTDELIDFAKTKMEPFQCPQSSTPFIRDRLPTGVIHLAERGREYMVTCVGVGVFWSPLKELVDLMLPLGVFSGTAEARRYTALTDPINAEICAMLKEKQGDVQGAAIVDDRTAMIDDLRSKSTRLVASGDSDVTATIRVGRVTVTSKLGCTLSFPANGDFTPELADTSIISDAISRSIVGACVKPPSTSPIAVDLREFSGTAKISRPFRRSVLTCTDSTGQVVGTHRFRTNTKEAEDHLVRVGLGLRERRAPIFWKQMCSVLDALRDIVIGWIPKPVPI